MHIKLMLSDSALTVSPCPAQLQALLKVLEKKRDGSRNTLQLFDVVKDEDSQTPSVITYQGFWKMIQDMWHANTR